MSAHHSYASALDAIGLYLERADAGDVLVNEIEGGFLVAYIARGVQHVSTFDATDMARLSSDALRHKGGGWTGLLHRRAGLRVRLRCLGRFLDQRAARAILVQERAQGFCTEYTGIPREQDDLAGLVRLHETLDDQQLRALSAPQDAN